jgi:hypothetical protein
MAVQAKCAGGQALIMQLNLTVPFGTEATVYLPTAPSLSSTTIYEGSSVLYRNGRLYTVAGVTPVAQAVTGAAQAQAESHSESHSMQSPKFIRSTLPTVLLGGTYSFAVYASD